MLVTLIGVAALSSIDSEKIKKVISSWRELSLKFLSDSIDAGIQRYNESEKIRTVTGREDECSGCGECIIFCPKKSISFTRNNNGFQIPVIDTKTCIQCGLCKKICPVLNRPAQHTPIEVYGAYSKEEMAHSASGGIVYNVAREIIESGGVVYGAAYTDKLRVKITRVDSVEDLSIIQGTKYVQADMTGVIENVLTDLKNHLSVLFTGTPCEVAGVVDAAHRKKLEEKLTTIEVICHGTPSQKCLMMIEMGKRTL